LKKCWSFERLRFKLLSIGYVTFSSKIVLLKALGRSWVVFLVMNAARRVGCGRKLPVM